MTLSFFFFYTILLRMRDRDILQLFLFALAVPTSLTVGMWLLLSEESVMFTGNQCDLKYLPRLCDLWSCVVHLKKTAQICTPEYIVQSLDA